MNKNNSIKRIDNICVEILDLPETITKYLLDNDKNLVHIEIKNKILDKTDTTLKIESKMKILNFKSSFIKTFTNSFNLVQIKSIIILTVVDNNKTIFNSHSKIKNYIPQPYNTIVNSFGFDFCKKTTDNTIELLTNNNYCPETN